MTIFMVEPVEPYRLLGEFHVILNYHRCLILTMHLSLILMKKQCLFIHNGHHKAYVDNLNELVAENPALKDKDLEEVIQAIPSLPKDIGTAVKNNAGGQL